MIRACDERDFGQIWAVIHDGARAYQGVIPADRLEEPYMSQEKLQQEFEEGVRFWGIEEAGSLAAVMGTQPVQDVTLIRHAYVRSASQKRGMGGQLLTHLLRLAKGPVLIGTWADAVWAIEFYKKYGFIVVPPEEKDRLLRKYWKVPQRQIETSVVLADSTWQALHPASRESRLD